MSAEVKQLVRLRDDRMVAGVCSGVARYLGVDPTLVRLLAVLGIVFSFGTAWSPTSSRGS